MLTEIHGKQNAVLITHCQGDLYHVKENAENRYNIGMSDNPIYDRIQQRIKALGISERAASIKAVGNAELLRNIRRGKSMSPHSGSLTKLARVLGVSETWLLTGEGEEAFTLSPRGIRFGGIVEAGTFRPHNIFDQDEENRVVPVPPDPRYSAHHQYAFKVVGDSMTEAKIHDGMILLAIDIFTYEKHHGEPEDGKLVIVARTRNGNLERELTVKRLRIFRDRMELRPESANTMHQALVFPNPPRNDDHEQVQIIAVVLSAIWHYG
jgi:SOS-response transcriptional repressor LexA